MIKQKGLGRGLDALLGSSDEAAAPGRESLATVRVERLQPGKYQPRTKMDEASLNELAASIKAQGLMQPILVRPVAAERYEIIAGERRWRAARLAGLQEVPVVVRDVTDQAALAMALIENIQRENLNPLEEAVALSRLISEFELTHQQAAEAVGRSRVAVSNLLRLLELPDTVKTLVEQRQIEMGHARALLGLTNRRQLAEVAGLVAKKGLSVRDTEALVRRLLARLAAGDSERSGRSGMERDPDIKRLEGDLTDKLGAKVELVQGAKGKGRLVITYHSLDELDGILAHIR